MVGCYLFDDLARVLLQLLDSVEALVGAVVPKPETSTFSADESIVVAAKQSIKY